jgi:hypothetical protein
MIWLVWDLIADGYHGVRKVSKKATGKRKRTTRSPREFDLAGSQISVYPGLIDALLGYSNTSSV